MAELVVVAPGPLTLVQDSGRPGYAAMGVSRSGAFDAGAYELGRRLLDNQPGAAALEVMLGRLTVRATAAAWAVITGALVQATIAGRPVGYGEPFYLLADEQPVLGSRATDMFSGLGPRPLAAGDVLRWARRRRPSGPRSLRSPRPPMALSRSKPCRDLGATGSLVPTSMVSGPLLPTRTAWASG